MPLQTPDTAVTTKSATRKATAIYGYGHYSASSFLAAFELARAERGRPRGMTTDQKQDLLRVMLSTGLPNAGPVWRHSNDSDGLSWRS